MQITDEDNFYRGCAHLHAAPPHGVRRNRLVAYLCYSFALSQTVWLHTSDGTRGFAVPLPTDGNPVAVAVSSSQRKRCFGTIKGFVEL